MCKKTSFANEESANHYIKKLKKTSTRSVIPVRAYLCEKCHNWHLTSIPTKEQKVIDNLEKHIKNLKLKINKLEKKLQNENNKLPESTLGED